MELYVIQENDDIIAVADLLDTAKTICQITGYTRIQKFLLNQLEPLKTWVYDEYYKKWEEFSYD